MFWMREGMGEGGCSLDRVAAISVSGSASGRLMVLYVRGGGARVERRVRGDWRGN